MAEQGMSQGMSLDVAVALLIQRLDAGDVRMDERFEATNVRLEDLTAHVEKTNGRLRAAETDVAILKDRLYISAGAIVFGVGAWVFSLFK